MVNNLVKGYALIKALGPAIPPDQVKDYVLAMSSESSVAAVSTPPIFAD